MLRRNERREDKEVQNKNNQHESAVAKKTWQIDVERELEVKEVEVQAA